MIATATTSAVSHSTNPTAAALTSAFRPSGFAPAARRDDPRSAPAPFDVERLYPNLTMVDAPQPSLIDVVRAGFALIRRTFTPAH